MEFSVLIGVQCVMILVRVAPICSICVIKACFVGNVVDYGVFWWRFLILMQAFQPMCLLSYNTWTSNKSKFSMWPSGAFGSIETIRCETMLLKQLKLFVLVQDLFLLVGGMLRLFVILSLSIPLPRTIWSGLSQVSADLNVMLMCHFLKLGIGLALVCVFEMMNLGKALDLLSVMYWVFDLQLGGVDFELDYKTIVDSLYGSKSGV